MSLLLPIYIKCEHNGYKIYDVNIVTKLYKIVSTMVTKYMMSLLLIIYIKLRA